MFIWLPRRDWNPLRSCKERAHVEGDIAGLGKRKWEKEQGATKMGREWGRCGWQLALDLNVRLPPGDCQEARKGGA